MWIIILMPFLCFSIVSANLPKPPQRRKPTITEDPKDNYGVRKRSFSLNCRADGEPPPLILWYKDEKLVESLRDKPGTSNKIIKADELIFLSFDKDDEGMYYCNASNSQGWTKSKDARVQLAFLEPITLGPQNQVTSVGENVVLQCKVPRGLPKPTVDWFHNTDPIQLSHHVTIQGGDLHINNVQRQDAGTYQCIARNRIEKQESKTADLIVHQKPSFIITPSNQQAKKSEDVEFVCRVKGDPKPSILWLRENGQIIPNSRSILNVDESLRILQVRPEDEGIYVCQAKNAVGSVDASARLVVLSKPEFTLTPEDITVAEGEKAVFLCQATGSPKPFLRWLHNGQYFLLPENQNTDDSRIHVTEDGSLVVSSARKSDEGKYECKASQKIGTTRASANLLVNDFKTLPIVMIELGPQNQTVLLGTTANLHCKGQVLDFATPVSHNSAIFKRLSYIITVSWSKNGQPLNPESDPRIVLLSQGTLQINDITFADEGNYTCRAEASTITSIRKPFYPTEWTANLRVSRAPPHSSFLPSVLDNLPLPPTSVDIVDVGDTWVSLRCSVAPVPVGTGFEESQNNFYGSLIKPSRVTERLLVRIEYIALEESRGWITVAEMKPDEIFRLTELQPESGYRILARTISPRGIGRPYVLPHTVYTRKRVRYISSNYRSLETNMQSIRFSTLQLISLSTSEIEVSGLICGSSSAINFLTGIRVRYKAVPLFHCLSREFMPSNDPLGYPISNPEYSDIECRHPRQDYFPSSSGVHFVQPMSEQYCSLHVFPDKSDPFWDISNYLPLDDKDPSSVEQFSFLELELHSSSLFRMVIDNLNPFACYEMHAEAYSESSGMGKVYGRSSRKESTLTYDSTPSQSPQGIRVRWVGGNSTLLEILWSPPPIWSSNGLITGYSLRLLGNNSEQIKIFHVGPKTNSYRIEHLQPKANFTLHMAAMTCHGEGIRSEGHPIIASHYLEQMGRNASEFFTFRPLTRHSSAPFGTKLSSAFTESELAMEASTPVPGDLSGESKNGIKWLQHTWVIVLVIFGVSLWAMIIMAVCFCRHQRRMKQRCPRGNPAEAKAIGSVADGYRMKTNASGSKEVSSKISLLQSSEHRPLPSLNQHSCDDYQTPAPASVTCRGLSGRQHHGSPLAQLHLGTGDTDTSGLFPNAGQDTCYESPASPQGPTPTIIGQDSAPKFTSTGSIFLATEGTTSSSSNNSSLHQGAGEARIDEVSATMDDPNAVTPYASTSLIEHMLCRDGTEGKIRSFPEVIPPPPRYPPPPTPDSPTGGLQNGYHEDECHYAQSDLHREDTQLQTLPQFIGPTMHSYTTSRNGELMGGTYLPVCNMATGNNRYHPQEYWSNGQSGVCLVQPMATMPNQSGSLYMSHMLPNGSVGLPLIHSQTPAYLPPQMAMGQSQGQFAAHMNNSGGGDHCSMMLMMAPNGPSSAIADEVLLPPTCSTMRMNPSQSGRNLIHTE